MGYFDCYISVLGGIEFVRVHERIDKSFLITIQDDMKLVYLAV